MHISRTLVLHQYQKQMLFTHSNISSYREGKWMTDESLVYAWGQWLGDLHTLSALSALSSHTTPLMQKYPSDRPRWDQTHSCLLRRGLEVFTEESDRDAKREYEELIQWVDDISKRHGVIWKSISFPISH